MSAEETGIIDRTQQPDRRLDVDIKIDLGDLSKIQGDLERLLRTLADADSAAIWSELYG